MRDDCDLRPGVLFDIDGTLLDTNYLHVLAWWEAFREAGHDGIAMATVHRAIGIASAELVHHVLGTEDQGVVDAHSTRYDSMRDQVVAFPRTAQLLTACAERGLGVVLATGGAPADLSWMWPAIGAEDAVLGVTTSGDVESAKPAPDLLTTAVHAHHLDPARVVVVGDTVWDIEAARAAGIAVRRVDLWWHSRPGAVGGRRGCPYTPTPPNYSSGLLTPRSVEHPYGLDAPAVGQKLGFVRADDRLRAPLARPADGHGVPCHSRSACS
jgi:HAD superfamily hydrolase (TIGR01509 family)